MAATFIITDGGPTIDIKMGASRERSIQKDNITVDVLPGDDVVILKYDREEVFLNWKLVTTPTVVSANDLKDKIVGMLASGSGEGDSTSANQVIANNQLADIKFNTEIPIEVDTVGSTTYLGFALPGADRATAVWMIKRIIATGLDVATTFADGNAQFDNIWNDRTGLSYS